MITKDQLIAAGYKPFEQKNIKEFTNSFFQKRFDDDTGKRYFITIAEYSNRAYDKALNLPDFSYEPDSQFESDGSTFNVQMLYPESVEQMEQFFNRMWILMSCDYYEEFEK